MKKISNELKIGATAFVAIVAFIWLYSFLKGRDIFNPSASYYVIYNQVGGLTETNPVEINGYKAGTVESVEFINDNSGRIMVTLSIDDEFTLPENTVAEITAASLIAGMKVQLVFGKGPGIYKDGDTIPGRLAESILTKFSDELTPVREKITGMISILDSVLSGINDVMTPEFRNNMRGTMANLNNASKSMNEMMSSKDGGIKELIADLNKFSEMLSKNSDKIGNTIGNLETITDTLAAADLYATVTNLKMTLAKTDSLMKKMNNGEGTAGQFFTNDSLYNNLNKSVESLNKLLIEVKENPGNFVHFSLFGKNGGDKKKSEEKK